jgi:hypothetical protein
MPVILNMHAQGVIKRVHELLGMTACKYLVYLRKNLNAFCSIQLMLMLLSLEVV